VAIDLTTPGIMKKTIVSALLVFVFASSAFSSSTTRKINFLVFDPANSLADQTSIYFDLGTVTTYRFPEDVQKSLDTTQAVPQIFSFSSDNVSCYSNGYGPFSNTTVIPLGIRVPASGTFIISAYAITNFDAATFILLEDRQTGTFTDMKIGSYSFPVTQGGMVNGRFFIHFTYPPVITTTQAGCANNDGTVIVAQDTSVTWTACILFDSTGNTLQAVNNAKGNVTFNSLPEGSYRVSFVFGTDSVAKDAYVTGNQIIADITSSLTYAAVNEVIDFTANVIHATQFTWAFGDSTIITGITHPRYAYSDTGTFIVTLKSSNTFGCVAYAYKTIFISTTTAVQSMGAYQVNIISDNRDVRISVNDFSANDYQYEMYDISGQLLTTGHITSSDFLVTLNGRATGIYIISVKNSAGGRLSKKVFLAE
jgi:PKD repeat protein